MQLAENWEEHAVTIELEDDEFDMMDEIVHELEVQRIAEEYPAEALITPAPTLMRPRHHHPHEGVHAHKYH